MKRYILALFAITLLFVSCGEKEQEIAVTSVSVSPSNAELTIGGTVQLTATLQPSNATEKIIIWSSSNQSVATISNNGLVTALAEGTSTVTASCGGKSGTCQVTVSKGFVEVTSISLNKEELNLIKGQSETLVATVNPSDATDKTVTWDSSDKGVASVDANGKVTAVAGGTATISAKAGNYQTTCKVTVSVPVESITLDHDNVSLEEEQSVSLVATVMPEDATDKTVTWSSSDARFVTVDESGKVTAIKEGYAIITANAGNMNAHCHFYVKKRFIAVTSVTLNKTELTLIKGQSEMLTATVSPSDATDRKVTWSSSNTSIATVDQSGMVTAVAGGSTTITAKAGDKQASCAVSVSVPAKSITLNSNELILEKGQSDRLVATIKPYDATDKIVWSSSNNNIASVDDNGTVVAVSSGNASISATAGSIQASCKVIVIDPDTSTNALFYTTYNGNKYYPNSINGFGANYITNIYRNERGFLLFDGIITSIGERAFLESSDSDNRLTSIVIPNSVTKIGLCAFMGCAKLTSIEIPNSVSSIYESAFSGCSGLTSIQIPNSIIGIGKDTFNGCTGLTSIKIPNSVTYLSGFSNCTGLTSIEIPNSVITIGDSAFSGCSGLTSVHIPNSVRNIERGAFSRCSGITYIEIPNSVNSIGQYAFSGCTGLKSVLVPISVNSIEDGTFSGCTGLTSIQIPNTVERIGSGAFRGCTGLKSLQIPKSVSWLGDHAFSECTGLTSIQLPNSQGLWMNRGAFSGCTKLASIMFPSSALIQEEAFAGCTGLLSIQFFRGSYIGKNAFSDCKGLTSIEIPENCNIKEYAFSGCSGLKTILLPNFLSNLGPLAFKGCTGLTSITCLAKTPYEISSQAFDDTNNCPIFVPAESVDAYKVAEGWSQYADRIQAIQ